MWYKYVISPFTNFLFIGAEEYLPLFSLCYFSSNVNMVTQSVTGNMADNGMVLLESEGDDVS
jgi:hypothetical protein